jgi:hypothetical protein
VKERLLRTPVVDLVDFFDNKSRSATSTATPAWTQTARVSKDWDTNALINGFSPKEPFTKRVFAAHSESDATADITGIEDLQKVSARDQFTFFRIPEEARVSHVSLVLKEPIYAIGASASTKPLVKANPQFHDMMEAIAALERYV